MENLKQTVERYMPHDAAEETDKRSFLSFLNTFEHVYTRDNLIGHITVSAWVINEAKTKVLLCHHNLYNRWVWPGGHADGNTDLAAVVLKEVQEETGLKQLKLIMPEPVALNVFAVGAHIKQTYVPAHLHYNVCYAIEADERETLCIKPDENSELQWVLVSDIPALCAKDAAMGCYIRLINDMKTGRIK